MLHLQQKSIDRGIEMPNNGHVSVTAYPNPATNHKKGAGTMFEQVFANLQKATESTVKMQQEMVQKWVESFPSATSGVPTPPTDAFADLLKKWQEISAEILKRQKSIVDQNYEAGLQSLEDIFKVAEAKSPQEYQEKITELYRQSFESLRELTEAQLNEFKAAAEKCSELVTTTTE